MANLLGVSAPFISFEGTEGVGKTTVIDGLCRHLTKVGIDFVRTREPGGTKTAEQVRDIFLDSSHALAADTELLLLFAARFDHLDKVILPALAQGKWVICDRFVDSTVAYQGFGRWYGDEDKLSKIALLTQTFVTRLPDKRIWLDLDIQTGINRAAKRSQKDRLEQEDMAFFARVYQGFEYQFTQQQTHHQLTQMVRIAADGTCECVLQRVLMALNLV